MRRTFFFFALLLLVAACGSYGKAMKSKDSGVKYAKAVELYNKKDFIRALPLLETLRDMYVRKYDSLEKVYYMTAYSHYGLKEYDMAALYFDDFNKNFPGSKYTEEMAYMYVKCGYLNAKPYEFDQKNTKLVMESLQGFVNTFPGSVYVQDVNNHLDDLRGRLQNKEYEKVKQYYQIGEYRAAVTAAQILIRDYPDIPQKEELEFLSIKAQYLFAANSIEKRKEERLKQVVALYNDYVYVNGKKAPHYNEASAIHKNAEALLKEIRTIKV